METMKLLQALFALVFLLVPLACSTSNASILQDTCKSFAAAHSDIGYDYCLKFFQANKGSATADKRGLAVIAANITRAAATSTAKCIAVLKASEKDKKRLNCLSACAEVYSDAVDQTGKAANDIASGVLQDAVIALSAVLDAPSTCEEGFEELDEPSLLTAADAEFGKEAIVALWVTSAL